MKMGKINRITGTIATIILGGALALGSFTGCTNPNAAGGGTGGEGGEGGTGGETTYSLTFNEDTSALVLDVGESLTLTVKEKTGTYLYDEENSSDAVKVETIENGYKLTGVSESDDANVNFYPSEAAEGVTTYDKSVSVKVYSKYALTISLDDTLKSLASKVAFRYGYSDKDGNALTTYETITADVTDGKATVNLKKTLSGVNTKDAWKGWNNCALVLVDAEGTEVSNPIAFTNYLSYDTADSAHFTDDILAVKASSTEKTFTINFTGFTAKSVTGLVYTKANGDFSTTGSNAIAADVTVAEDGLSATFTVLKAYTNSSSYFQVNFASVVVTDTSDNTVAINSGNINGWYDYNDDSDMTQTLAYLQASDATVIDSDLSVPSGCTTPVILIDSSKMPSAASSIIVTYTVGENDIVAASKSWMQVCTDTSWTAKHEVISWASDLEIKEAGETYSVTITDGIFVKTFLKKGMYIAADSSEYTGKITVSYFE